MTDTIDFGRAKAAIANLQILPQAVNSVITQIRATNFGPYPLSGSCDYGAEWYTLGINTEELHWESPQSFSWVKDYLLDLYDHIESTAQAFPQAFALVQQWLTVDLPAFSQQFNSAIDKIEEINSPPYLIKAEFQQIVESLKGGVVLINQGVAQLASYSNQLNEELQALGNLGDRINGSIADDKTRTAQFAGTMPCGGDDLINTVNQVTAVISAQYQNVINAAQNYGVASNQAVDDVNIVLGTMLIFQSSYAQVLSQINAAESAAQEILQKIHLRDAAEAWNDFANSAKQALTPQ